MPALLSPSTELASPSVSPLVVDFGVSTTLNNDDDDNVEDNGSGLVVVVTAAAAVAAAAEADVAEFVGIVVAFVAESVVVESETRTALAEFVAEMF